MNDHEKNIEFRKKRDKTYETKVINVNMFAPPPYTILNRIRRTNSPLDRPPEPVGPPAAGIPSHRLEPMRGLHLRALMRGFSSTLK